MPWAAWKKLRKCWKPSPSPILIPMTFFYTYPRGKWPSGPETTEEIQAMIAHTRMALWDSNTWLSRNLFQTGVDEGPHKVVQPQLSEIRLAKYLSLDTAQWSMPPVNYNSPVASWCILQQFFADGFSKHMLCSFSCPVLSFCLLSAVLPVRIQNWGFLAAESMLSRGMSSEPASGLLNKNSSDTSEE